MQRRVVSNSPSSGGLFMSRLNSHRLLSVMVLVFIGWGQADARPARVGQLPNGSMIGCASCHVNPGGGGTLTSFGRDINNNYLTQPGRSGQVVWNAMLAMLDSDGDGVSNGQELGDPDGDGTPDASIQVTNPGDPNSFVQQQPDSVDIREVSVQSVDAANNSFFIQRNGQKVSVDVSQALMITLDQRNLEDIIAIFFSGNVDDLAQLIFPISALMVGDTVSILGMPLSETTIQALIVIRQAPSQTRSADLDSDGDVDFSDFLLFAAAFGTSEGVPGYSAAADLDGDGTVAFSDFLIFANAFGKPVG